jgi:hypothetical protein
MYTYSHTDETINTFDLGTKKLDLIHRNRTIFQTVFQDVLIHDQELSLYSNVYEIVLRYSGKFVFLHVVCRVRKRTEDENSAH